MKIQIKSWLGLASLILIAGCGGTDATETAEKCVTSDLIAQCPAGTEPDLSAAATSQCSGSGEADLITQDGSVTGSCGGSGTCQVVCKFATPCACGVDRITSEGVFCVSDCTATACGNGECEAGETSETCAIDCGSRCTTNDERCDGANREICSQTGTWEPLTCPDSTSCEEQEDGTTSCVGGCGTPGTERCNDTNRETCAQNGDWEPLACPAETRCQEQGGATMCVNDCGTPDAQRCNGTNREVCAQNGSWSPLACPEGTQCQEQEGATSCTAIGGCGTPGTERCNDTNRESCAQSGDWEPLACPMGTRCQEQEGGATMCVDECEQRVWYRDMDEDTYGDINNPTTACDAPEGYVANPDDCDDNAIATNPDADETCDDIIDNNCNQEADCDDSACDDNIACIETQCADNVDNDIDGAIDCQDQNCNSAVSCSDDCVNYCDALLDDCAPPGVLDHVCRTACETMDAEPGDQPLYASNTLQCRTLHFSLVEDDQADYCELARHDANARCQTDGGVDCDSYCAMMFNYCQCTFDGNLSNCRNACEDFSAAGIPGAEIVQSASLTCRLDALDAISAPDGVRCETATPSTTACPRQHDIGMQNNNFINDGGLFIADLTVVRDSRVSWRSLDFTYSLTILTNPPRGRGEEVFSGQADRGEILAYTFQEAGPYRITLTGTQTSSMDLTVE